MNQLFFLFLFITFTNSVFSQDEGVFFQQYKISSTQSVNEKEYFLVGGYKAFGSPYAFRDFSYGKINNTVLSDTEIFKINYNVFEKSVDVLDPRNSQIIYFEPEQVDSFLISKPIYAETTLEGPTAVRFVHSKFIYPTLKPAFYEVIYSDSSLKVFKNYGYELEAKTDNFVQRDQKNFKVNSTYHYIDKSGKLKSFKPKSKEIKMIFAQSNGKPSFDAYLMKYNNNFDVALYQYLLERK